MTSVAGTRHRPFDGVQPTSRSRTWTDNGVQYSQRESSYNGPNAAYFTFSRTAGSGFDDREAQGRKSSLLGSVVSGLANYVTPTPRRSVAENHDLAYGDDHRRSRRSTGRPKSLFSRIAATLTEPEPVRPQRSHSQRRQPQRRHYPSGPRASARRRPVFVEDYSTSSDEVSSSVSSDRSTPTNEAMASLENAAEHHRREAKAYRSRLEQTCREGTGTPAHLQNLARKIDEHENARESAIRDLKRTRADVERAAREQSRAARSHPGQRRRIADDFDDPFFNDPLFNEAFGMPQQQRTRHSFAGHRGMHAGSPFGPSPFAAFDNFFADFERMHEMHNSAHQHFFTSPGGTFTASFGTRPRANRFPSSNGGGPQRQQVPGFTPFSTQPRSPPATILKPEEAKTLFATYNERWNNVSASDSNIPFPARGLNRTNLNARNTVWAPSVGSPIESWSDETIMKANAQAFFLGAVGFKPVYNEAAGGKIELGIDKSSGSPAQSQQLIAILKKERIRWHSDRLAKRNGGRPGQNESLRDDDHARAVYHGVCELLEATQ